MERQLLTILKRSTLLVEAHPSFADQQRNAHHFNLVSRVEGSSPVNHERVYVALAIFLVMILAASFTGLGMLKAALLAAGAMLMIPLVFPLIPV